MVAGCYVQIKEQEHLNFHELPLKAERTHFTLYFADASYAPA